MWWSASKVVAKAVDDVLHRRDIIFVPEVDIGPFPSRSGKLADELLCLIPLRDIAQLELHLRVGDEVVGGNPLRTPPPS